MKLHGTVGPARTTISAIAEEAGVQRATVYRHFEDEAAIFDACSSHWEAEHPMPDIDAWVAIGDPADRARRALSELYAFYEENEGMLQNIYRDAPLVPAMAAPVMRGVAYLERATDAIVTGRPERGRARNRVRAAIGHALFFPTWQSLVRAQGLSSADAAAMMAGLVEVGGAGVGSAPTR